MIHKLFKIAMLVLVACNLQGCYNDFDEPAPLKVWTKEDFADSKLISIKDFKQLFYSAYGKGSQALGKTLEITEDYVISGKVISSDQAGNVYKSVYIYDEDSQSAIELKLMVSNYVYFPVGQTLFVKAKGLAIGNYRYMLSLGGMPTAADISKGYANRNLEDKVQINAHIFAGAKGALTDNDILVVTPSTYQTLNDDMLGRLVRFEGITYKSGSFDSDVYPQYLEQTYPNGSTTANYQTKYYKDEGLPDTYAYSYNGDRYYGSAWFSYGGSSTTAGNYIVRVSGYSNFALQPLPENGSNGNITAIYTKYSSSSGGYVKYQLLLNSFSDMAF